MLIQSCCSKARSHTHTYLSPIHVWTMCFVFTEYEANVRSAKQPVSFGSNVRFPWFFFCSICSRQNQSINNSFMIYNVFTSRRSSILLLSDPPTMSRWEYEKERSRLKEIHWNKTFRLMTFYLADLLDEAVQLKFTWRFTRLWLSWTSSTIRSNEPYGHPSKHTHTHQAHLIVNTYKYKYII